MYFYEKLGNISLIQRIPRIPQDLLFSDSDIAAADIEENLMNYVIRYYHQTLKASVRARRFLADRNILDEKLIQRFQLGFSDRTLGWQFDKLPSWQSASSRGALQRVGILKPSGHEFFRGALVFPFFDEHGNIVGAYPCFNSKVIQLIIKCTKLNSELYPTHYWLISNNNRKTIFLLANQTASLAEECKGMDRRVIGQAFAFLRYLLGEHKQLVDACWSYITNIEVIDKDAALYLRNVVERDFEEAEGISFEINKAQNDFSYRKSIIQRLSASEEISADELILFSRVAENKVIQNWVKSGGKVIAESDLERDFLSIEVQYYANDGGRQSKDNIKESVENFASNQKEHLHKLNPLSLFDLTSRLLEVGLAHQVSTLLQPIVPVVDIWPSPIVRNYIRSLLESDQLTTLKNIISEIHQDDWDDFIWQVKARMLDLVNDTFGAISAIESALKLFPLSLSCWHHLVSLHKRNDTSKDDYTEILARIPNEIFTHNFKSKFVWHLLYEISISGDFFRVENIIVNWFIQDPNACAKAITDFHFTRSATGSEKPADAVSATTEHCLGGFSYIIDDRAVIKLIIQGVEINHSCMLEKTSPLGQLLLEMKAGESIQKGMQEIKLLEILPPYVAVFRLALELRQTNNDGSDCFYAFTLPENPDEMIASLEKKIGSVEKGDKQKLICENPQFPLFLKGHMLGSSCPVHSALEHFTNKASVKLPLPTVGEAKPEKVIIDIYSTVYIGLTGLIHGFIESNIEFFITIETKAYLKRFLDDITRDTYMRIGVTTEGKLWRVTSKEVQSQIGDVLLATNHILEFSKTVSPILVDMPPDILQIQDAVDGSVYSSLRLSISNDIPWLCIDEMFSQLFFKSNYRVVNAREFFISMGSNIEIRKKLPGLYHHVCSGLPYPLTYIELLQMANLADEDAQFFLAEILSMYPNAYVDINSAVDHLSKIMILTLSQACINGEIINGLRVNNPRNNGLAERVFNVCCYLSLQVKNELNAERKLAFLLYTLVNRLHEADEMINLVTMLGSNFILGHFLSFEEVNKGVRDYSSKNGLCS